MITYLDKKKNLNYFFVPSSLSDLMDKHIQVGGETLFIKRINEFGDACICEIGETGSYSNIGNLHPGTKKYLQLHFKYHGIHCIQRIYFTDIRFANE